MTYQIQEKRAGDPSQVVASSQKASQLLGWKARYSLKEILESAFLWNQKMRKIKIFSFFSPLSFSSMPSYSSKPINPL
ncbi:hypothetical protein HMPREF9466_00337 [Fusobacterium necrophorum subsp. funduliforme 1_1_36S]|nr:hypothetical protein HMPREF9466_00337 [Fusobacterium necrophorum subsp. funduliforme 1_1_36S]